MGRRAFEQAGNLPLVHCGEKIKRPAPVRWGGSDRRGRPWVPANREPATRSAAQMGGTGYVSCAPAMPTLPHMGVMEKRKGVRVNRE